MREVFDELVNKIRQMSDKKAEILVKNNKDRYAYWENVSIDEEIAKSQGITHVEVFSDITNRMVEERELFPTKKATPKKKEVAEVVPEPIEEEVIIEEVKAEETETTEETEKVEVIEKPKKRRSRKKKAE